MTLSQVGLMEIKMPIKFHGNYVLLIHSGEEEDHERCQNLIRSAAIGRKAGPCLQ